MTWTAPRTWTTAEVVTAAHMNTHVRDNLVALAPGGATSASWTPVLKTSDAGTFTMSATTGRSWRVGPIQFIIVHWTFSSLDPPSASGNLTFDLPVASAGITGGASDGTAIGTFHLFNSTTPANSRVGAVYLSGGSTARFRASNNASLVVADLSAVTDILSMQAWYTVA